MHSVPRCTRLMQVNTANWSDCADSFKHWHIVHYEWVSEWVGGSTDADVLQTDVSKHHHHCCCCCCWPTYYDDDASRCDVTTTASGHLLLGCLGPCTPTKYVLCRHYHLHHNNEWMGNYCINARSNWPSASLINSRGTRQSKQNKFACLLHMAVAWCPPPAALRYGVYFRFCGCRHVRTLHITARN